MSIVSRKSIVQKLVRPQDYSLIMPYFVVEGKGIKNPVKSMPGVFQFSIDNLVKEVAAAKKLGIPAVIIFGIPSKKDLLATGAYAADGIVQKAIEAIKKKVKDILVITDVCLCEYTSHGHCGVVKEAAKTKTTPCSLSEFIDLKQTLKLLAETALSQARAGADMVAPSAMMHGQVKAIRAALDKSGLKHIPIMGYSVKYASAFYGPFRDAALSAPKFGDRSSYQLNPSDGDVSLKEVAADIKEDADIVMVKPALPYLDIIRRVKDKVKLPLAAYNVSGEYAMVKAAAKNGWVDEKKIVLEIMTAIHRAGAGIIISYHACDIARWRKE
ncbi:MAG: porphobilinogen synthase [Candidatus Omnitrophica bacterium]|nr:porphobilinogen synthase [Candidatus Omnitrophota bacterium]